MSIKLNSVGGGSVTIQEPNTASDFTLSVPARAGAMAIDGPSFSAFPNTPQTLSAGTDTKILFQAEEWDTNNNFASSRFTPTVAGYYTVNASMQMASSFTTGILKIFKNGNEFKVGQSTGGTNVTGIFTVACQIYFNGSTDYIEVYGNIGTGQAIVANGITTFFQASMVRAA